MIIAQQFTAGMTNEEIVVREAAYILAIPAINRWAIFSRPLTRTGRSALSVQDPALPARIVGFVAPLRSINVAIGRNEETRIDSLARNSLFRIRRKFVRVECVSDPHARLI